MRMSGKTIPVMGGGGIGLALAKRCASRENRIIIRRRRAEALAAAKRETPALEIPQADLSMEGRRVALVGEAIERFPELNAPVNNAVIQSRPAPLLRPRDRRAHGTESATNPVDAGIAR